MLRYLWRATIINRYMSSRAYLLITPPENKTYPIAGRLEVAAALREGGLHAHAKRPLVALVHALAVQRHR